MIIAGKSARSRADSREEIQIERAMPLVIVEGGEPASGRRRPTDDVDDDVDAAEALTSRGGDCRAAFGSRDIRRDE